MRGAVIHDGVRLPPFNGDRCIDEETYVHFSGQVGTQRQLCLHAPRRVNSWPSSDPLVTSVGGSQLYLDNNGQRLQPDSVWNDGYGAGGGGVSAVFSRPLFQAGVTKVVGSHRGTPDISMSAAVNGAAWVYWSFAGTGGAGWELVGGTSEATPIFSGIVALADQQAGRPLRTRRPGCRKIRGIGVRADVPGGCHGRQTAMGQPAPAHPPAHHRGGVYPGLHGERGVGPLAGEVNEQELHSHHCCSPPPCWD